MAPQNSLPGSVDVINQKTGDVVAQYAKGSDRIVNLTDTSIVRVNASQESVNFFEREGNDLIVHMKDGSTVRYNSFFTVDGEGLHSEMIFEDELGTHQAAFPYAAAAGPAAAETIVPAFSDVSLGSLVGAGASGFSALAALGGLAAVGGIVGVAAAANNSGGGGSNNNNNGGGDNGSGGGDNGTGGGDNGGGDNGGGETPATPTLRINAIASDNIINSAEILITQVLSGQTYNIPPGQLVTITLNGKTYYAEVMGDGSWKTSIPSGDLGLLPQGDNALTVSVNDADGNAIVRTVPVNVDTSLTGVAIAILSTDDYLNASEAENPLEVRGVTTVFGEGVTIYVTVNGINYPVTSIDASGRWSVTIPSQDLLRLEDGPNVITATVVLNDESAQDSRTLNVQVHRLPDPVMDAPFGDGYLNAAEKGVDQVLSGNTGVTSIGQRVTVQVAGKTYQATVDNDGT